MEGMRSQKFTSLALHPWYGKLYRRLTQADIEYAQAWIAEHAHLDPYPFEQAVNRIGLDQAKKSKNNNLLSDLLLACK
jgi:hypothetical protein